MGILQNELDRVVKELCCDASVKSELIRRIGKQKGVELGDDQIQALCKAIQQSDDSSGSVEIEGLTQDLVITESDIETAWRGFEGDMEFRSERAVQVALEKLPPDLLESLYRDAPAALRHRRQIDAEFRRRLRKRWREGLDRLDMLILMAQESGEMHLADVNERIERDGPPSAEDASLLNALTALHARACRIGSEVLLLLGGGFADGANGRWRSLHEVAVTAMFLSQHKGDTPQRYLDHAVVERMKSAKQYQQHCETLGYERATDEEMAKVAKDFDAAVGKYGAPFKTDYGWAAKALGKSDPKFWEIEAGLDMSHWRPFYRMACQSVHAGSHALLFSLSNPAPWNVPFLAGASNAGLCDPGHCAAISLNMASVALLTFEPKLDSLITCKCMQLLGEDIGEAFFAAHQVLEEEMEADSPET